MTCLAAIALLLYMLASYLGVWRQQQSARAQEQLLADGCAALRAENERLQQLLAAADEDAFREAQAREWLGMVKPGEIVFYFD